MSTWYLLGAGNMGLLAAYYLRQAGFAVTVLRHDTASPLRRRLTFADGRPPCDLILPVLSPAALTEPPRHLVVACKAPYSAAALEPVPLTANSQVLRLQNGLGSLDGLLPGGLRPIEVVTTSAVKQDGPEQHQVVAENETWMGGGDAVPDWFEQLSAHWPNLSWPTDFQHRQWHKLVANAVINPLTALHDVPNGRLLEDRELQRQAAELCREADQLLTALDPTWPGDSLPRVMAVASATAGNTSSMRADVRNGARTEIDAINGYFLRRAAAQGLSLPAHERIVAAMTSET